MSEPVIRAEGLGKRYRIGALQERHDTLRDQIAHGVAGAARRLTALRGSEGLPGGRYADLWALRDVSFEVGRGEVVGVIGQNGAGKSTLLKILSRVTEPTEGRAELRGRVGALLEVGTGFHPELTGRENIFLSGAILGMKKAEIRQRFGDITDFAGVERFIDTPVKRYSSGMYVRLAFAVAAFLEPEIFLVDEVLAVGDAAFQRKCLGKMGSVAREGRTILLVSHNMGAISRLCPTTIWLAEGTIREIGPTAPIVHAYLAESAGSGEEPVTFEENPAKDSQVRAVRLLDDGGRPTRRFSCDEPVIVELSYQVRRQVSGLYGCFQISASDGTPVLVSYSHDAVPNPLDELPAGTHSLRIVVPARTLAAGDYRVHFSVGRGLRGTTVVEDCGVICSFALDDLTTIRGNGRLGYFSTLLDWGVSSAAPVASEIR